MRIPRSTVLMLALSSSCKLVGANEAYLPQLGRYDYVLGDPTPVTGQLVVVSAGGAGIGYHWEVDAFTPSARLPHASEYSRNNFFPLHAELAATGELASHQFARDGDAYHCTASLVQFGRPSGREVPCTLIYRGP